MTTWTTRVRCDLGFLDEVAGWWNGQPAAHRSPFVHTRVLACWAHGFLTPAQRLHIRVLHRDGEPVAALPLYRDRGRLRSLSRFEADPFDVVMTPAPEVVDHLPRWLDTLTLCHLYRLSEDSPVIRAAPAQPRWLVREVQPSPYLDLSRGMAQVRAGTSAHFRRELRRRRRRLEELGEVTFRDHHRSDELGAVLDAGLRLEAAGWKGRRGSAVLQQPAQERFYRALAEVAEDESWLRLSALYLDERMVAFRYGLVYEGRRYEKLIAYDESPDVAALSVGNLLLEQTLERSCDDGLASLEFGYGASPYKHDWTATQRTVYNLTVYGVGPVGRSVAALRKRGSGTAQTT